MVKMKAVHKVSVVPQGRGSVQAMHRHICHAAGGTPPAAWIYGVEHCNPAVKKWSPDDQNTKLIFCRLNFDLLKREALSNQSINFETRK